MTNEQIKRILAELYTAIEALEDEDQHKDLQKAILAICKLSYNREKKTIIKPDWKRMSKAWQKAFDKGCKNRLMARLQ